MSFQSLMRAEGLMKTSTIKSDIGKLKTLYHFQLMFKCYLTSDGVKLWALLKNQRLGILTQVLYLKNLNP